MSNELAQLLTEILARQRNYGMHDPWCGRRQSELAQTRTGAFIIPADCNCWLAND